MLIVQLDAPAVTDIVPNHTIHLQPTYSDLVHVFRGIPSLLASLTCFHVFGDPYRKLALPKTSSKGSLVFLKSSSKGSPRNLS